MALETDVRIARQAKMRYIIEIARDLGIPPDCGDGNACTRDCDPAVGCVSIPVQDGQACSDLDRCTVGDACQGGTCVSGTARDCDDTNACTADGCDALDGCVRTLLPDGTGCGGGRTCRAGVCG